MALGKLAAIVGPTASGKSDLAMEIARKHDGEIICADSRTIYRGMNIGTAKPSRTDQVEIPHHVLDIINPDEAFSAAEFKVAALNAIKDIESRGRLPILAGLSGLYAYALLYDYHFPAGARNQLRDELQQLPIDQLVERLQVIDPEAASQIDLKNPRRVIRAIETAGLPRTKAELRLGTILVGLRPSNETLTQRIFSRTENMVKAGLVDEVKNLIAQYDSTLESFKSPGYMEIISYLENETTLDQAQELINLHTRQLAKRQLTWFKRNPDIHWFESNDDAMEYISKQLKFKQV